MLFVNPLRWYRVDWLFFSKLWSHLHVSKPLERAFCTCAFEAMFSPRDQQSLRASLALKAYPGWLSSFKEVTSITPAILWLNPGKTGKSIFIFTIYGSTIIYIYIYIYLYILENMWNNLPLRLLMSVIWTDKAEVTSSAAGRQSQMMFMTGQSKDRWMPDITAAARFMCLWAKSHG